MPFEIVRNDITNMHVDAIVNTANPRPVVGAGTDSRIHEVAGPKLLEARQLIGRIEVGHAAITPAFKLNATYVIHTVGPVWLDGKHDEEMLLRSCYENSLNLAVQHGCESVAFPLISTGNYGFPKDKALQIAISAFSAFLLENEMQIYLVVFNRDAYRLSEKLFSHVASYIDQNYVDSYDSCRDYLQEYRRRIRRNREIEIFERTEALEELPTVSSVKELRPCATKAMSAVNEIGATGDLDAFLKKKDAGFIETLLDLIKKSGKKNAAIYKKANVSKQNFSKLINNPNATITKTVAVAFALALELDLAQTKDLIGRAGYTLTNSSIFDLIIQFHIEQRMYNIIAINVVLYEFDQALLGSV